MGTPGRKSHPRKRESAVAAAEQIQKLVAVIQRQFLLRNNDKDSNKNSIKRPDDAAARALGYQLGQALVTFVTVCLDENVLQSVREEQILEGLFCRANHPLHPSVSAALFQQIQQAYKEDNEDLMDVQWIASWILRLEEAAIQQHDNQSVISTLGYAMQTYRVTLLQYGEVTHMQFLALYQQLQHEETQLQLIALAVPAAVSPSNVSSTARTFHSVSAPLWAAACLAPTSRQAWAILHQTTHSLRQAMCRPRGRRSTVVSFLQVLGGMTQALHWSFLLPWTTAANNISSSIASPAASAAPFWLAWWDDLVQLGQMCWRDWVAGNPLSIEIFGTWWQILWKETLPRLLQATTEYQGICLSDVIHILSEEFMLREDNESSSDLSQWSLTAQPLALNATSAIAWASWLLTTPAADKQVVFSVWQNATQQSTSSTIQVLRRLVTLCLSADPHWNVTETETDTAMAEFSKLPGKDQTNFAILVPLLPLSTEGASALWQDLFDSPDFTKSKLSPSQQSTALLCGVLEWHENPPSAFAFLQKLLECYPHLSITLMPMVFSLLNKAAAQGDGSQLLQVLDFACRVLVMDPHCATEFWNILLQLLQPGQSATSLRTTILRFFPTLCRANKRLYRRIIETLGGAVSEANVEIRLAVTATVAELAQYDLIRDVSDVIGWIQGWLSIMEPQKPMERLMVYYALESLHYLVVAEELDFDVVVKVLNKRLCPITDTARILALHPIIQEALVRLLGDGECSSERSSEEDESEGGNEPQRASLSPQVQRAVETLLDLGIGLIDHLMSNESESTDRIPEYRILCGIVKSLNNYSNLALGLNEQDFKDAFLGESSSSSNAVLQNYFNLQRLIVECMENLPDIDIYQPKDSLIKLAQRVVKFEEESIGTALWQKKGSKLSRPRNTNSQVSAKAFQSMLPATDTVEELAGQRVSMASAVARLFCSDGNRLTDLRDNADASVESDEPFFLVLAIQAHLSIASRIVSAQVQSLDRLMREIETWYEDYVSADAMYLALASISLYVPPMLKETESSRKTLVEDITDAVVDAFRSFRFENTDLAKICLGIVGASCLRSGTISTSSDIVEMLIDSVKGYGGEKSFGAFYGLALIAQMIPFFHREKAAEDFSAHRLYFRVSGLIVEEFINCFDTNDETAVSYLVACLKSGTVQTDILTRLSVIPPHSLRLNKNEIATARYLSLCCALALPSLGRLNEDLLKGLVQLFEGLEWGCGKGIALPPMLRSCRSTGAINLADLDAKYRGYSALLEQSVSSDEPAALDDLLLAVSGASSESISHVLRRAVVGNIEVLGDDARARSLLATLMKSVGLPCFGAAPFPYGAFIVPEVSKLDMRDVIEMIEEAALEDGADAKYSDMGLIAMSVVASLGRTRPLSVDNALPPAFVLSGMNTIEPAISSTDFAKLPTATPKTTISVLLLMLEQAVTEKTGVESICSTLSRLLSSLEPVALPKQFSKGLLYPLLEVMDDEGTREAWMSLLVSQCHGRRPATMDGSEFVQLYHQLAAADEKEWKRITGQGSTLMTFVQGLEHFLPKCSPLYVDHIFANVWKYCWKNGQPLQHGFLRMCKNLLTTTQLASKFIDKVVNILLNQVLLDLQSIPLEQVFQKKGTSMSTFAVYMECVRHVPVSILDKNDFFRYAKSPGVLDGDVLRILCAAELLSLEAFDLQRQQQERSKIVSFLARCLKVLGDDLSRDDLRHVYCALVETANPAQSQAEQLAEVFDVLLQLPPRSSVFGLEWLALFVRRTALVGHTSSVELSLAYLWCDDWRTSPFLPLLGSLVVSDLPMYLGQLVQEKQMASTVFNLIHRLLSHWTTPSTSRTTIHILRQCLATCRPTKEDVLVGVVADTLLASITSESESSSGMT